jgi:hypothetical protein
MMRSTWFCPKPAQRLALLSLSTAQRQNIKKVGRLDLAQTGSFEQVIARKRVVWENQNNLAVTVKKKDATEAPPEQKARAPSKLIQQSQEHTEYRITRWTAKWFFLIHQEQHKKTQEIRSNHIKRIFRIKRSAAAANRDLTRLSINY